jgi:hypothetical protein
VADETPYGVPFAGLTHEQQADWMAKGDGSEYFAAAHAWGLEVAREDIARRDAVARRVFWRRIGRALWPFGRRRG